MNGEDAALARLREEFIEWLKEVKGCLTPSLGFGSALAMTISWSLNHSVWWAVLHGFFGWGYVIYYGIWL